MFSVQWILVWTSVACLGEARRPRQSNDAAEADMMNIKMLGISVPGTPGEDYPIFSSVPVTQFTCEDKEGGGYYADTETGCQVYHTCGIREDLIKFSTICPNGTIFDQEPQTCQWWYMVNCQASENFFYTETNIRGADVASVSTFTNSKFAGKDSDTVSQVDLPAVTDPPRLNQTSANINSNRQNENRGNRVSDNAIYFSIPEELLRAQIFNAINNSVNAIKITQVRGNRRPNSARVQKTVTSRTRVAPVTSRPVVAGNRRQTPPRNIRPQIPARNQATTIRTFQANSIEADYDYDYDNNGPYNIRPRPTIPPSTRTLSFQNGKVIVKGG